MKRKDTDSKLMSKRQKELTERTFIQFVGSIMESLLSQEALTDIFPLLVEMGKDFSDALEQKYFLDVANSDAALLGDATGSNKRKPTKKK